MIDNYQKRISGPLPDRIDSHIEVPRADYGRLTGGGSLRRRSMSESTETWPEDVYNAWELRAEALQVLSMCTLAVAYVWVCCVFAISLGFTWDHAIPLFLALGAVLGLAFRKRRPQLAPYAFVCWLQVAALGTIWLYGLEWAPYVVIPTVVFAGVLLSPVPMFLTNGLISLGAVGIGYLRPGPSPSWLAMLASAGAFVVATLASWLASRNLYTALQWALESYASALAEAQRARRRRGQLRQALKSMDEASSRLQWMNFELARARDAAEELRRLKQQFVANVSHELRTPLALIAGFSEMMYLSPESYGASLPAEYMGDVREIYRNSQHLVSLIDDILDLSRISVGRMILSRQEVEPEVVIRQAVEAIRPLVEGKGLALDVKIEGPLPGAYLDPTRVRQVLLNLLNNARRFTDSGRIEVSARRQADQVLVSVSDTGIGISSTDQPKLFEEFRQLDGSLARQHDGTGLGLAICKEFVEMHGGRIWMESEGVPGEGSTFHFSLPLNQREIPDTSLRYPVRRAPPARPVPTLLLVGKEAGVLPSLERQLDQYEVVQVQEQSELPGLIDRFSPLAVLLNPLPRREVEQLRELEAQIGNHDLPIILLPLGGEDLLARSLGVDAYIVKPVRRSSSQPWPVWEIRCGASSSSMTILGSFAFWRGWLAQPTDPTRC